jgi:hypothetical protein
MKRFWSSAPVLAAAVAFAVAGSQAPASAAAHSTSGMAKQVPGTVSSSLAKVAGNPQMTLSQRAMRNGLWPNNRLRLNPSTHGLAYARFRSRTLPELTYSGFRNPATYNGIRQLSFGRAPGSSTGNSLPDATTWQALQVPRPALARDPRLQLDAISCPTPGKCAAVGTYADSKGNSPGILLTQSGARWIAVAAPLPKGASKPAAVDLSDVSCAKAGECLAVGDYSDAAGQPAAQGGNGDTQGLLEVLHGGAWTAKRAPLPHDADFHPGATVSSVSCPSTKTCTAVGWYAISGQSSPWILTQIASGWKSIDAPTPSSGGGNGGSYGFGAGLVDVDCVAPGSCAAVGSYATESAQGALFDQESGGVWKPLNFSGAGQAYLSYVACSAATACEAVGGIGLNNGNEAGFALSDAAGVLTGTQTPLPVGVLAKNVGQVDLYAVACVGSGNCAAIGDYFPGQHGPRALLLSLAGGTWTAPAIPVPTSEIQGELSGLQCQRTGCVAVGQYVLAVGPHAILITGSGDTWTANPVGGQSGAAAAASLAAVDCPAASPCVVAGEYQDTAGNSQGLIANLKAGTWTANRTPIPSGAGAAQGIQMYRVACPSSSSCIAVGTNEERSIVAETLSSGKWTAVIVPNPAGINPFTKIDPTALSCTSAAYCVATAVYVDASGGYAGAILVESKGHWTDIPAPLPADTEIPKYATITSLSCPAAKHCVAAGYYLATNGLFRGWILIQSGAAWTALSAPAPPNAVPADIFALTGLSCRAVASCTAVGVYGRLNGPFQPLIITGAGGTWTAGEAPQPANAATGINALGELLSVSCSKHACVSVGVYYNKSGVARLLIDSQSVGAWHTIDGPLPSGAQLNDLSSSSISCWTKGCAAAGSYADKNGNTRAFIATSSFGKWTAATPTTGTAPDNSDVTSVTCASTGACMAAGYVATGPSTALPLLASTSGPVWSIAQGPLPSGGLANSAGQSAFLASASCPPAGRCVAVGAYIDAHYASQGLVEQQK